MDANGVKALPAARACLYGTGLDKAQIDKPIVAIVYSQNEITPGHVHLDNLANYVQRGIAEAGGTGIKINAGVGICDGIAMGHDGMKYSLPSRETNRDSVIEMIKAHGLFEGVVYIGACDKNLPGYLMAAAALGYLPGIFVTAGPMMPGCVEGKGADVVTSFGADAQYALRQISQSLYNKIMEESCPGVGSCAGLFTANSMACVTEALGLTLPGMATAHAVDNRKYRLATQTGRQIMELIRNGITIKDILTEKAFYNALAVDMAIGTSTNTVLHVPAIAEAAGYQFDLDKINEISRKTPNILRISPATTPDGKIYRMIDFDRAGGIPVAMNRLRELLDTKVQTVTGSLEERLNQVKDNGTTDVIKSLENPYSKTGGIAIYRGNLAYNGAVIKESAVDSLVPKIFKWTARVFNDESDATNYIKAGKVRPGEVMIIRYEGPAGGPGMREMLYPTSSLNNLKIDEKYLKSLSVDEIALITEMTGLQKDKMIGLGMNIITALITDGRFSGGTAGPCFAHVGPEAYNRGPIAFVQDGDKIEINMIKKEINLLVEQSELEQRMHNWTRVEKPTPDSILANFRKAFEQ